MHCFRGYCCGNYLEPVVQWTKLGLPRTQSQTRLGQVSTWMGDHIHTDPFISILDSRPFFVPLQISLHVTYCVSRTVHNKCLLSKHCWASRQTNLSVEFYHHLGKIATVSKTLTNSCGILVWTVTKLFTEHQCNMETRNVTAVLHMLIWRPGSKIIYGCVP